MTNADKYLKEGITPEIFCKACTTGTINVCALVEWLRKEVKPTLTEDEKVILRNIDETKIKRFTSGNLFVYTPLETEGNDLKPFNHLFQFIKPRRRI